MEAFMKSQAAFMQNLDKRWTTIHRSYRDWKYR